jgi:hypothetical protein
MIRPEREGEFPLRIPADLLKDVLKESIFQYIKNEE